MRDRRLVPGRIPIAALAAGLALAGALAAELASAQPPPTGATLTATCGECHDEVASAFPASPHGRRFAFDGHYGAASCASCHGDPTKHLETNDPADIVHPERLATVAANELCLECHGNMTTHAHWQGSVHQRRGVGCLECHDVHDPARPDSEVDWSARAELCMSCHTDVRSEMRKTSHHPVREGKMDCLSCHDPHGTMTKGNLRAASVNELCFDCHTEKRGPFLWEHAPVRESCLTCHTPHGSNHLKLQSTSVPYLCQQCHSNTRHPGTLYDATRLPTLEDPATGSNRLFNRACLDCHAAVHGSNHPSSPYLAH